MQINSYENVKTEGVKLDRRQNKAQKPSPYRRRSTDQIFFDRVRGTALGWLATLLLALPASAGSGSDVRPVGAASTLLVPVTMVAPYHPDRLPRPDRKPQAQTPKVSPTSLTTRSVAPVAQTSFDRGIAAYRGRDLKTALRSFVKTADNKKATHFERAAGAFWAARVADQMGRPAEANEFRAIAATYDRSFYGQLARAQLGLGPVLSWEEPRPSLSAMNRLGDSGVGRTAADHVAAGRLTAADQVLMKAIPGADAELRLAILAFAVHHRLPATAMRLASRVEGDTGIAYRAAYYPVGGWLEQHEFRVDRALVHAVVRQESGFNPNARSNMGAVGLMQLLPSTANYVIKVKAGGPKDRDLTRSVENLELGQHYLEYLLTHPGVRGDLIKMLVAYNAGPGNLAKWERDLADVTHDPLLFIETIPAAETRAYVEKVMAAYWIYRDRFGQDNPTLNTLAAGTVHGAGKFAGLRVERLAGM